MQIHYFQRYHSKENVDTSNTMLMLSRLYNYNADKFFSMLNSLILGEDERTTGHYLRMMEMFLS